MAGQNRQDAGRKPTVLDADPPGQNNGGSPFGHIAQQSRVESRFAKDSTDIPGADIPAANTSDILSVQQPSQVVSDADTTQCVTNENRNDLFDRYLPCWIVYV